MIAKKYLPRTGTWDLPVVPENREDIQNKKKRVRSPSAEEHPPYLKRSLSHMDIVESVQPVFTMQGPSGSANNISRLRNNTNLINGFYKVNNNLTNHHDFVFPGARGHNCTV